MKTITDTKSTITLFDRVNSQLQNTIFQHHHAHWYIHTDELTEKFFCDVTIMHGCPEHSLSSTSLCHHCWNTPPTTSQCLQPLFGLHQCSANVKCNQVTFFPHVGIQWHTFASSTLPCHIVRMPLVILSECPSAAICHTATKCNGILVGRVNPHCYTINTGLWCQGLT